MIGSEGVGRRRSVTRGTAGTRRVERSERPERRRNVKKRRTKR